MEFKLCQCCASQQNLNILTARYAKILESNFSIKIGETLRCYICNDCISVLIDTSIFRMRIERTQKAIGEKILQLKLKKQNAQRISNDTVLNAIITEYETSYNDKFETNSKPVQNEGPKPSHQRSITAKEIFDQLDAETLICHICKEQQTSFTVLSRHINVHYPNFVCETCGKGFITQSRLNSHIKIHNPIPRKCNVCGLTFSNINTMMSHRQTKHLFRKPNKCNICGERFVYRYHKVKHMADVHGQTDKKYKCHQCSMTFLTASRRSSHFAKKHNREFKYICEICGKSFSGRDTLKGHMTSHTTERPFQCTQCPKTYPRKKTLREHLRIHENDKRFSCEICGKLFTQKCSLKGHMKVHEKKEREIENAVDLMCF